MKLKNILLVVEDVERSRKFYHDLFGLDVILDLDGNVILTEGLVLQDARVWEKPIGKPFTCGDGDAELYFEENELDTFLEKLNLYPQEIRFLIPDGAQLGTESDPPLRSGRPSDRSGRADGSCGKAAL